MMRWLPRVILLVSIFVIAIALLRPESLQGVKAWFQSKPAVVEDKVGSNPEQNSNLGSSESSVTETVSADPVVESGETEDDAKPENQLQNPLIRSLSGVIEGNEKVFGDAQGSLQDDLIAADQLLTRAKITNRSAIAEANRQRRIRGPRSPNIVLLVCDGISPKDAGCYGNENAKTPNLDAIAKQGMLFEQFYGHPSKVAAFKMLMSGMNSSQQNAARVSLATVLWDAGYSTAVIGDCRMALDYKKPIFDEWFGEDTDEKIITPPEPLAISSTGSTVRLAANSNSDPSDDVSWSELFQNEISSYLGRHQQSRPFFLTVSLKSEYFQAAGEKDRETVISGYDQLIGHVSEELQASAAGRNTILLITSTNNFNPSNPDSSHLALSESTMKSLLIVTGKSIESAQTSNYISGMQDLLPTIADLVHANRRPNTHGNSLVPVLKGQYKKSDKERVFRWENPENKNISAVRIGKWKAIFADKVQLFDLDADPLESHDIASEYPDIVRQLRDHGKIQSSRL
ncbi:MAG: hypothetical protein COA78_07960 [Blastopirellula sp.]|nr:MAG: hypothetical protein COA78_07960 [Blastopirellula sp.]